MGYGGSLACDLVRSQPVVILAGGRDHPVARRLEVLGNEQDRTRPDYRGPRQAAKDAAIPLVVNYVPSGVASPESQWPPSFDELGEFGFDVDGDEAEEVDVLAVAWGDEGQQFVGDLAALAA